MANNQQQHHSLIKDDESLAIKHDIMERDKRSNLLNGISDTSKFFAGIMLAAGMAIIGTALKAGVASLPAAIAAMTASPAAITFLAIAAVATVTAVGTSYYASHIYQSAGFDQTDYNAKATAKHLVEALKENNMCLTQTVHEGNCRADGKQWAQVVRQEPATARIQ